VAGAVAGVVVVAAALGGGLFAPHDPAAVVGPPFSAAGGTWPLGTDGLGRDVLSRVLAGGAELVLLALAGGAAATAAGVVAGLFAGWVGGMADRWLIAALDLLAALPLLLVALVLAVALPGGAAVVVAAVAGGAPLTARVVRDAASRFRASGWVEAARGRGESTGAVLLRELAPALGGLVAADAALRFVLGLQLACTVALLGFGPQPPSPDWALMLRENLPGAALNPAGVAAPAAALVLLACGVAWSALTRREVAG
jgi:ABC-type dipeptide/oligopeptide/nickel transport system permease subunit